MPHGSATYGSAANVSSSSIQTYGVAFYGRNGFGGEKGERERAGQPVYASLGTSLKRQRQTIVGTRFVVCAPMVCCFAGLRRSVGSLNQDHSRKVKTREPRIRTFTPNTRKVTPGR